ncbi:MULTISPECIES: hypothetical protein [Enterobacteriaceae]|uniref:hypothetical protein n=1 Tax=Enterobacteriaceae TaxID=543 RepID=UPI0011E560E2|nr:MULTISPECIES: hypothetical protein [Klebsiella]ECF2523006.1 hypothetical protein [Salmonella enterica subsp. enterica serovar Agona]ECL5751055.1 hypothetical protein [Salmonella enterica]EKX4894394.1 hypothetical protein [Raoultella ornithinolytica]EMC8603448.1 hypothetical protein [Citrobacter freundii]EHD8122864.1 hypothetical protein [Salmonella enterica]
MYNRSRKIRASPALQQKSSRSTLAKLSLFLLDVSDAQFFHSYAEARANPAKPLRLLLRIALAFLPFGQKRKALPVMLFILLIRFYCARYSVGGVDSPPKLPDIISHIKPLSENTYKIMISSDTNS